MNQLEEALREQIDYCVKMEHFHSAVFCFDQEKRTIVEELLTQTSHIENGKRSLKNQYFSSQNSFQAAL